MTEPPDFFIVHLQRADGSSLFLDSFDSDKHFEQIAQGSVVQGVYGEEPSMEAVHSYRKVLYNRIDRVANRQVREQLFIPKFLAAAAVFLVSFFFMSLIMLTPVPVLDELIISSIAAVAAYIGLGRQQNRSEKSARRRITMRAAVDSVRFSYSDCVNWMQQLLKEIESSTPEQQLRDLRIAETTDKPECSGLIEHVVRMLQNRMPDSTDIDRLMHGIDQPTPGAEQVIYQRIQQNRLDLPLLVFMRTIEQTLAFTEGLQ